MVTHYLLNNTTMKIIAFLFILSLGSIAKAQPLDSIMPVRGLAIVAPSSKGLDRFIKFMENELTANNVNTLVLRVDWKYQYKSYPKLADKDGLTKDEVKKLVAAAKRSNIELIPQINLLGHQSWASTTYALLKEYPQFDETPHVTMPEKYEWPNPDGLYCKSYCPLHPDVHKVVFGLVDEIMEVFEAKTFHAGMDEVFYIGDDKCPRCKGKDKAELFAGEVTTIRNHLAQKGRKLWIWGDRLLDGSNTGLGMWEASMNNTHRAVDMIPKDVVICDWHYERADPTAAYLAMKGLSVITCPWNKPEPAKKQVAQTIALRENGSKVLKERYLGMMHTVWSGADGFLDKYYELKEKGTSEDGQANCFNAMFSAINSQAQ
jgi:hypothetical protein